MGEAPIEIHDGEFVRVRVPAALERSLHLALAGVHAPFFERRQGAVVEVVLREAEWRRIAPRFASAEAADGFRLVSVRPGDAAEFPARLRRALAADGVQAHLLPSFHNDHVLVRADQLERCLAVITRCLGG